MSNSKITVCKDTSAMEPLHGINEEHPITKYLYSILEAFKKRNILLDVGPRAKELLSEAGFVDIVEKTAIWRIGHWPKDKRLKEIGRFARMGSEDALYPFGLHMLTTEGWTPDQVLELCNQIKETYARQDTKSKDNSLVGKYYFKAWFVYGRKPREDENC